jgi:hypothetical protein
MGFYIGLEVCRVSRSSRFRGVKILEIPASANCTYAMVGINASHSMGLILLGLVFGFLALAHGQLLFQSSLLLVVGLAMLGGLVALCKVFFFSVPLTGISISLACYVASIALSRALIMRS